MWMSLTGALFITRGTIHNTIVECITFWGEPERVVELSSFLCADADWLIYDRVFGLPWPLCCHWWFPIDLWWLHGCKFTCNLLNKSGLGMRMCNRLFSAISVEPCYTYIISRDSCTIHTLHAWLYQLCGAHSGSPQSYYIYTQPHSDSAALATSIAVIVCYNSDFPPIQL